MKHSPIRLSETDNLEEVHIDALELAERGFNKIEIISGEPALEARIKELGARVQGAVALTTRLEAENRRLREQVDTWKDAHERAGAVAAKVADKQTEELRAQLAAAQRELEIERLAKEQLLVATQAAAQALAGVESENARLRAALEQAIVERLIGEARQVAIDPAVQPESDKLGAVANRLWEKVNARRCDLIKWKISGEASERDLAELAELQALADDWIEAVAPLPIAELEAYMRERGIEPALERARRT